MSETLVAKRYANALHDSAVATGKTGDVDADVKLVADTLAESKDLRMLFASPVVSRERKAAVIDALFGNRIQTETLSFLRMLVSKRREGTFLEVAAAYQGMRDDEMGVVVATARTPVALSAESEANLRAMLEQKTGKKIRLLVETDRSLVGGLVVRVGDIVYDGSVANRLAKLKEQFTQG